MDIMSLVATLALDSNPFTTAIGVATSAFGGLASLVGQGLSLAVNVVWNFGQDVIQTGMGFDEQMSSVQSVLGSTEGTLENMNNLRAFALEQAKTSVFTAEQTGQAYYYMGMAGWKSEQMIAGLPGVMHLAAASGEDLGTVSDIVTDSITAFGLTANDVGSYVDILAKTVTNANTDVQGLGYAFKYTAPIAGSLGLGVDDVALSLGLMANAGIKGSQAGTTMRSMLTRLSTDAGASSKKLGALGVMTEKLGVQVFDTNGEMRDWGDILKEAREGWGDLSEQEQLAAAKMIAGQTGMSGFMAIMNASEEDFNKLEESIATSSGAAEDMSKVKLDSLAGDVQMLNSAFDVLKITLFDDLKGPLRELVQFATGAIDRITKALEKGGLEGGIEQLGIEIGAAMEKLKPILTAIGTALAPVVSGLIGALVENTGPFIELGVTVGSALLDGIVKAMNESDNPAVKSIAKFLGVTPDTVSPNPVKQNEGEAPTMKVGVEQIEVTAEDIQRAIDEAEGDMVTIGGTTMNKMWAQQMIDELTTAAQGPYDAEVEADTTSFGAGIQNFLSGKTFTANVKANVSTSGGNPEENAIAMGSGRIFTSPTVFGYAGGHAQIAGDAGAEAVVGVTSLHAMIRDSVRASMSGMMGEVAQSMNQIILTIQSNADKGTVIQLDSGVLVGALIRDIDSGLGDLSMFRNGVRA